MAFKPITLNTPAEEPAHILAEDDAAIYESIIGGDCVLPIGGLMKATVLTNNKVRITDGAVVVGGHVGRIVKGDYEDMTIANGQTGQNRNDIIAARFLAGADGGSDSYSLVVIQGTPGSAASDPVIVRGDLYAGDKQRDYPLWRVCLEGLSITKVEQMHEIGTTNKDLSDGLSEGLAGLKDQIETASSQISSANSKINTINSQISAINANLSITTISSGFTWNMSLTSKYVVAYKIGRIVYLYAYFRNSNGITTSDKETKVFTLPASLTPITNYAPCTIHGATSLESRINGIVHKDDRGFYIYTPGSTTAGQAYIHVSAMYVAST